MFLHTDFTHRFDQNSQTCERFVPFRRFKRLQLLLDQGNGTVKDKSEIAIPGERVENVILLIRGERVILDPDLSETPSALPKKHPNRVSSK
jgi:hypothetical protein